MLVVELSLLLVAIHWRYHSQKNVFNVLDVNEMRENVGLFQKPNKWDSRHFFVLQIYFSLVEQQSALLFECPVVLLNIDEIKMFELILKGADNLDGVFHHHLPVDFIHDHKAGMDDWLLVGCTLLPQQVVVDLVLVVFVVVVEILAELVQQEDELLLVDGALDDHVGHHWLWLLRGSLLGGSQEQVIEVVDWRSIGQQAAVYQELHILAEAHGVGLWFGVQAPQLGESDLIAFFEDDRIVVRLRHLNLYNFEWKVITNQERLRTTGGRSFSRFFFGTTSWGTSGRSHHRRCCATWAEFVSISPKRSLCPQGRQTWSSL